MPSLPYTLQPIDENHVLYGNYIGVQYVFEAPLEASILSKAIALLVDEFPALAGRYNSRAGVIELSDLPIELVVKTAPGSASDHSQTGTVQERRLDFVNEPARAKVLRGQAPLSTFTLTQLGGGGCILGVAISHVLTDAAGLHFTLRRLGDIYTEILSGKTPEHTPFITRLKAFQFGTRADKSQVLSDITKTGLSKPPKLTGLLGGLIKSIIIRHLDKSADNPRVIISLSAEEVARLKQTVLTETGEDWISTNVALCAHFAALMACLMYGSAHKTRLQIGQLLDLRQGYFDADANLQSQFVGNAILIETRLEAFPDGLDALTRADLARRFKKRNGELDGARVKTAIDLVTNCLSYGYSYPGLDIKNPMIALNNQSKMPVYAPVFGTAHALRVIPQDVGDNIMFFPAPDGGIEVYIRDILKPKRQNELLTPEWQAKVYDF